MLFLYGEQNMGLPQEVFTTTVLLRDVAVIALCALVIRQIYRPEEDLVRWRGRIDDPSGGVFDRAPDAFPSRWPDRLRPASARTAPPADHVDANDALRVYLDPPIVAGPVVGLQILDPPTGSAPTTSTVFIDAATGQERWRTASGALSSFSFDPEVAGGTLFENGEGGRLRARDPLTGAVRLEIEMMSGPMLAVGAGVFVADDNVVVAVESSTGAPRWSRDLGRDRDGTPLGVVGGVVVVAGDQAPEN
jgi:hypothetical protein